MGLDCRKEQCQQLSRFSAEVLEQEFNEKTDIAMITGDFNILRDPLPEVMVNRIVKSNKAFEPMISELNSEVDTALWASLK